MQLLVRWAVATLALYATVWILHAFGLAKFDRTEWWSWLVAAVVMGLVNSLIRPVARLLTAPLNCLTFGLIAVVVNGAMFLLVPYIMKALGMPVFEVDFLGALVGAILLGFIGGLASKFIRGGSEEE